MPEVQYENTLLQAFDSEVIDRLHLKSVAFKVGHEIEFPGKPIKYLFFLEEGMASMTTTFRDGREVEVGMFGYESVIGVSALMGSSKALTGSTHRSPVGDTDAVSRRRQRNLAVAARSIASPCGTFKLSCCNRLSLPAAMRSIATSRGWRGGF